LPDTADELLAMAKSLGAGSNRVKLRESATERALRSSNLTIRSLEKLAYFVRIV